MHPLIVNADDFGYSRCVNRGIIEAHERGIVTSASLMVNRAAAAEAADYGRGRCDFGVGLHVELRHWRTQRRPWSRVRSDDRLQRAVAVEVAEQIERFEALMGCPPTHLDSHHHRHRLPLFRSIFETAARDLGVPLRHLDHRVRFCGEFYGHDGAGKPDHGSITPGALISLLEGLPPGATELGCHPGYVDDLHDWYRQERVLEIEALCHPSVREAVGRLGLVLATFRALANRSDSVPADVGAGSS